MQNPNQSRGLVRKFSDMLRSIAELEIPAYAANASYFLILSAVPAILLLMSLLRYTPLSSQDLVDILDGVLPDALMPTFTRLITSIYTSSSMAVVSMTALAAIWAASRGVYGILTGLNRIYGVKENRGYIYTRLISIAYMFLFILVLILTLAGHVFGQAILARLPVSTSPAVLFLQEIIPFRFFVLLFLQTLLFTVLFMVLPNRRNRFLPSLPGAILASLGWTIYSDLFSVYVERVGDFSALYGSLSTVALSMLWLYFCMSILFYGGAFNKYLMDVGVQFHTARQRRQAKRPETEAVRELPEEPGGEK